MFVYLTLLDTQEEKSKFERIYIHYRQLMFYIAKNILDDEFLSEDAVHDAFINIAKSLENISDAICPRTKRYVVIIVRNISLNMLKKQKLSEDIEDMGEYISDELVLEDEVLSKISFDFIIDQITRLPVIYKDVLYLSYVEDLNTNEISNLINISNETVKKRLQRGRKKLAENIREVI